MISRIEHKLNDKNSFTYMAYMVLKSKLFSAVLLFLSSVIVISALPKDDYGLYVLMTVFFAFFELLLSGPDASLTRYLPISGKNSQHRLIATVLALKIFLTFFILICLYILFDFSKFILHIPLEKLSTYCNLYLIISISFVFQFFTTTALAILNAFMLYSVLFKLTLFNAFSILLITIIVYSFKLDITQYIFLMTAFSFVYSIVLFLTIASQKKISFISILRYTKPKIFLLTLQHKIIPYSLPLFGVGILSYVKNYLPSYLFGTMTSLETLATYNIFKRVFDFLHKGHSSFIESLYPKIFKMIDMQNKGIDKLFWIGLGIRLCISISLLVAYPLIIQIYGIQETQINFTVFIILLNMFLILYFGTHSIMLLSSFKNTKEMFYASFLANIVSITLIPLLFYTHGIIGALYGEFASRFVSVYVGVTKSHMLKNDRIKTTWIILNFTIILTSIYIYRAL